MDANERAFHRAVGRRLTELRRQRQYTQAELARLLGVSQQTVFAYEFGDRRVSTAKVAALARLFRTSTDALLGIGPLPPLRKTRISPAELRHLEELREITRRDRRVVTRVTAALRRPERHTQRLINKHQETSICQTEPRRP